MRVLRCSPSADHPITRSPDRAITRSPDRSVAPYFLIPILLLLPALTACSRPAALFNDQNARAHVGMLAGTIGNRPVGTPANARARDYIIDQLRLFGFDVRVQATDARRAEIGRTARVSNIIAVRRGSRDEAIGLVSHYDSAPHAPGAADDALGVAVSLEAARVLGARTDRTWSLMVLVTDGEEAGLMGAAALVTDREVMRRLQAYINIEAVGSSEPVSLFETGPGNGWLVRPWASQAPNPRGDSVAVEIYRRLPNDTDFSVLKRHGIPGLNFAAIGDSYAYHTARDTPERLSSVAVRDTGENVVAIVDRLDAVDITQRSSGTATYFDIGGTVAASYGPVVSWLIAAIALLLGVVAWVRVSNAAIAVGGVGRWLLTIIWTLAGATLVAASMVGATWALRAGREVYHPWYARPDRLFLLLLVVGVTVGWSVVRIGQWLPARAHGLRHPVLTWSVALPFWILLAGASLWFAPAAAYLWTVPLLFAGFVLAVVPATSAPGVRIASIAILAVSATMWLFDIVDLLRFMVAIFGRLPIITPIFVYAAVMAAAGVMLIPPLVAATGRARPLVRPSLMTAVLLLAVSAAAGFAYVAPAYTFEQPLRRRVRAIQPAIGDAIWEVGGVEPGLDLGEGAPGGWTPARSPLPTGLPWTTLSSPFVFRATAPALGPPPVTITTFVVRPLAEGTELEVTVVPREPGLTLTFLMPPGAVPARSSLPGIDRMGGWAATYVAPPAEGVVFRASFGSTTPDELRAAQVLVASPRFPNGTGWQSLPAWLPQERMVWTGAAVWQLLPGEAPAIAPVPPLR